MLGEPTIGDVYLGGVGTGGSSQDAGLAEADEHEAEQGEDVVLLGDEFEPGPDGGEEGSEDESEVEPELERLDGEGSEVEVGDVVGGAEPDDGVLRDGVVLSSDGDDWRVLDEGKTVGEPDAGWDGDT